MCRLRRGISPMLHTTLSVCEEHVLRFLRHCAIKSTGASGEGDGCYCKYFHAMRQFVCALPTLCPRRCELAIKVWRDSRERVQKLKVLHTTTLNDFEGMLTNLLSKVKHASLADEWEVKRKRRVPDISAAWSAHGSPEKKTKSTKTSPHHAKASRRRSPNSLPKSSSPESGERLN